jgi:hypothetical protein
MRISFVRMRTPLSSSAPVDFSLYGSQAVEKLESWRSVTSPKIDQPRLKPTFRVESPEEHETQIRNFTAGH